MSTKNSCIRFAITELKFTEVIHQYDKGYYCLILMGNFVLVQAEASTPEEAKKNAVRSLEGKMKKAIDQI